MPALFCIRRRWQNGGYVAGRGDRLMRFPVNDCTKCTPVVVIHTDKVLRYKALQGFVDVGDAHWVVSEDLALEVVDLHLEAPIVIRHRADESSSQGLCHEAASADAGVAKELTLKRADLRHQRIRPGRHARTPEHDAQASRIDRVICRHPRYRRLLSSLSGRGRPGPGWLGRT